MSNIKSLVICHAKIRFFPEIRRIEKTKSGATSNEPLRFGQKCSQLTAHGQFSTLNRNSKVQKGRNTFSIMHRLMDHVRIIKKQAV